MEPNRWNSFFHDNETEVVFGQSQFVAQKKEREPVLYVSISHKNVSEQSSEHTICIVNMPESKTKQSVHNQLRQHLFIWKIRLDLEVNYKLAPRTNFTETYVNNGGCLRGVGCNLILQN